MEYLTRKEPVDEKHPSWMQGKLTKETVGGYNYYPPNMTEITVEEYERMFHSLCLYAYETRQPMREEDGQNISTLNIFWFPNGHYVAMGSIYIPFHQRTEEQKKNGYQEVKFYKGFICEHKNITGKNLGRCWNEYTCKDCGFHYEVDSSD